MSQLRIKVADKVIGLDAPFRLSLGLLREYLTDETSDFQIPLLQKDGITESIVYGKESTIEGWEGKIQLSVLLQIVAEHLIDYDVFLMHGATISINNSAYIFSGPSGIGKTTHIKKWIDHLPETSVVNGDKPFIISPANGSQPLACGSPWAGKENWQTNIIVPLKSIILMERADENHIEQISFPQAFPGLLQQIYMSEDENKMRKTLKLLQRLNPSVSFYRFQCNNFKNDCFETAYNTLVGDKK